MALNGSNIVHQILIMKNTGVFMKSKINKKIRILILISLCLLLLGACTGDNFGSEDSASTKDIPEAAKLESESVDRPQKPKTTLIQPATGIVEEGNTRGEGNISVEKDTTHENNTDGDMEEYITNFEGKYADAIPNSWGEKVKGVITEIDTDDKVIALTFDACGGKNDGYDEEIIEFLIDKEVPATLFINSRWIDRHLDVFLDLADNPLFEIANHGHRHKPLSVAGKSAYGISGTQGIKEVVEEILYNDEKIYRITGQKPRYFRSGTAYYDEVAVGIAGELNYKVVNYNVLGDAGATYNKQQIVRACSSANPGSIILFHMNRPEKRIAEGIIEGITHLLDEGYTFVKLSDYHDYLR